MFREDTIKKINLKRELVHLWKNPITIICQIEIYNYDCTFRTRGNLTSYRIYGKFKLTIQVILKRFIDSN